MTNNQKQIRIGADVGGTFTDVILIDTKGCVWIHKVSSTPPEPSLRSELVTSPSLHSGSVQALSETKERGFEQAVLSAVAHLLREACVSGAAVTEIAHGTTVATNAVLEHRGAKTALITTKGFRDVLELRRIRAPQMYDLFFEKPKELVERYLRFELTERISATGEVLIVPTSMEFYSTGSFLRSPTFRRKGNP